MLPFTRCIFTIYMVLAAALAFACGDGNDAAVRANGNGSPNATASRDPGPPCTNEATRQAQLSDPDFSIPDTEARCRLRRALVTKEDLPGAWQEAPFGNRYSSTFGASISECAVAFPDLIEGAQHTLERSESAPGEPSLVGHELYALDNGAAERIMRALHRSCQIRAADVDSTARVELIPSPPLGDDSLALTFTLDADAEEPITSEIVIVRRYDVISVLRIVDKEIGAESDLVASLANRMDHIGPIESPVQEGVGCQPASAPEPTELDDALADALVTLEDLPAGWVENPPEPCGYLDAATDCAQRDPPEALAETQFAGRPFYIGSNQLEWLYQSVGLYGGDDAENILDEARGTFDEEHECTISLGEDYDVRRRWLPVSGTPFGDDVLVGRVIMDGVGGGTNDRIISLAIVFRANNTLTYISVAAFGEQFSALRGTELAAGDPIDDFVVERLSPIVETARQKLEAIQSQLD